MYTQAHSELAAVRPLMSMVIGHGVPIISAMLAAYGLNMELGSIEMMSISCTVLIFLLVSGGVDTAEVVRHEHRFLYVAVSALTKAVEVVLVIALLVVLLHGDFHAAIIALHFAALYLPGMLLLSLFTTWLAIQPVFRAKPCRIAVVGVNEAGIQFAHMLTSDRFISADFVGFFEDRTRDRLPANLDYPVVARITEMSGYLAKNPVEQIFVALTMAGEQRMGEVLDQLLDSAASVHYLHDFVSFKPIHESVSWVTGIPVYTIIGRPDSGVSGVIKRLFDVVGAVCGLILLSPLLILVAFLIKKESPGSVFFQQTRYGADGRPFSIYKFRSMTTAACAATNVVQATQNDARVTRLGRFLRRSSIDELPQLFNVIRGDMSLVGPRPHAVPHNEMYRGQIRGYMLRHKVRPGLTGWAQVHGLRGETETVDKMENRVRFDLDYLRQWSIMLDVYIVLCTFKQVMRGV